MASVCHPLNADFVKWSGVFIPHRCSSGKAAPLRDGEIVMISPEGLSEAACAWLLTYEKWARAKVIKESIHNARLLAKLSNVHHWRSKLSRTLEKFTKSTIVPQHEGCGLDSVLSVWRLHVDRKWFGCHDLVKRQKTVTRWNFRKKKKVCWSPHHKAPATTLA